MITLNHLVRRQSDVSAEAFRDYWLTTHAEELTRLSLALGVRRFTASETVHDDDVDKLLQQLYQTAADSELPRCVQRSGKSAGRFDSHRRPAGAAG